VSVLLALLSKWVYSIVGCVFVVRLFTESLPSNGSVRHNMLKSEVYYYLNITPVPSLSMNRQISIISSVTDEFHTHTK
jgi:hypothetical protein